jgi:hypothetical protein
MNAYKAEKNDTYPDIKRVPMQEGDFLNYIDIPGDGYLRAAILEDWTVAVMASIPSDTPGKFDTVLAIMPFDDYKLLCLVIDDQTAESIRNVLKDYPVRLNYIYRFTVPMSD